ncbi:unnamed protein product [Polarella glacialis]|uniref:Uncharacterized protein n=1 Tax=Polarella glacialis TaxID=89957 RepID=A0A813EPI2_POLGL|nr:unnamed protein product [Polarella glacialis]CAE8727899.1 unnamed protein product [Polarella glacialis]
MQWAPSSRSVVVCGCCYCCCCFLLLFLLLSWLFDQSTPVQSRWSQSRAKLTLLCFLFFFPQQSITYFVFFFVFKMDKAMLTLLSFLFSGVKADGKFHLEQ